MGIIDGPDINLLNVCGKADSMISIIISKTLYFVYSVLKIECKE